MPVLLLGNGYVERMARRVLQGKALDEMPRTGIFDPARTGLSVW